MEDYFPEVTPHVYIGNGEWIPVSQVQFVNIQEDFQGIDTMTFIYNNTTFQSHIRHLPH